jgi:hypothetical protein
VGIAVLFDGRANFLRLEELDMFVRAEKNLNGAERAGQDSSPHRSDFSNLEEFDALWLVDGAQFVGTVRRYGHRGISANTEQINVQGDLMLTLRNGLLYSFFAVADKSQPGIWLLDQAPTVHVVEDNLRTRVQAEDWLVTGTTGIQEVFLSSQRFSFTKGDKVARQLAEAPPATLPTLAFTDWSQEVWVERDDGLWMLRTGADGPEYCLVDPTQSRAEQLAILERSRFALPDTVRDGEQGRVNSGRPAIGKRVGRATSYPWRWSPSVDLSAVPGFLAGDLTHEVWPRFDAAGELVLEQDEVVRNRFETSWADAATPDPFYGGWDRAGQVPSRELGVKALVVLTDRRVVFTLAQPVQAQPPRPRGTQVRHAWMESVDLEEMVFPAQPKRFLKAAVPEKRFYLTSVRFVDHARSTMKLAFDATTAVNERARSDQEAAIAQILSDCGRGASQSSEKSQVAKMTVNVHRNVLEDSVGFASTQL